MSSVNSPGVQIKEVATLPASVAQVATAIPAFIGYTKLNPSGAIRISSMAEYTANFGGPSTSATNTVTVTLAASGADTAVVHASFSKYLYYSMQFYFANGGGPCYVVSVGLDTAASAKADLIAGLTTLSRVDEPTLISIPDSIGLSAADHGEVMVAALTQCNDLKDRFVIMDTIGSSVVATDRDNLRNNIGTNYLKYGAAYYPHLATTFPFDDTTIVISNTGDGTVFAGATLAAIKASTTTATQEGYAKFSKRISDALTTVDLVLPPSPAIAGVYAATDRNRGVWKAPANVSLTAVKEPAVALTDDDHGNLNVADNGKSINGIRFFSGQGTLVWGARTLAGNDNEWRYVPVRRLFITVEESIKNATQFVVFEPNDANTWTRTKAMIENYLTGLWRQGALAGPTPAQAFFVNVGLGETMTAQDILEGNLIIEIGMAAVRPAEFITLRFSHKLQEA